MTETKPKDWEEEAESKLIGARYAFLTYGRTQGFKDHIKYAKEEIENIKSFICKVRTDAVLEERKRIEGLMRLSITHLNKSERDSVLETYQLLKTTSNNEIIG